jgi:hypothetical protein
MTKTKKNLQKKRRLQKKTRGFGKGKGATASHRRSAEFRRRNRDRVVYEPTSYIVKLDDDNSEFEHIFERDPSGPKSLIHYELYDAIRVFRHLDSRNNIPTLNIWDYEVKYENDEPYVFVPKK